MHPEFLPARAEWGNWAAADRGIERGGCKSAAPLAHCAGNLNVRVSLPPAPPANTFTASQANTPVNTTHCPPKPPRLPPPYCLTPLSHNSRPQRTRNTRYSRLSLSGSAETSVFHLRTGRWRRRDVKAFGLKLDFYLPALPTAVLCVDTELSGRTWPRDLPPGRRVLGQWAVGAGLGSLRRTVSRLECGAF